MLKKIIFVALIFALFFNFGLNLVKAAPSVDQACLPEPIPGDSYGKAWLNRYDVIQIFTPSKEMLDSVTLGLGTTYPSAKARVRIYDFSRSPNTTDVLAEKYITVKEDNYYKVDFTDIPMHVGIFAIRVEMANQNEPLYWNGIYTPTPDYPSGCYPSGYAFLNGIAYQYLDMVFSVSGYNRIVPVEEESADSTSAPSPAAPAPSAPASTSSNSSASTPANSVPEVNNTTASKPPSNVLDTSNKTTAVLDKSIIGDTTSINQKNEYSDKLAADKELQDSIAFLVQDMEKNRYKGGAFGLKGRVGRFLTWPVFYGICCLILIFLIVRIIRSFRKSKENSEGTTNENDNRPEPQS